MARSGPSAWSSRPKSARDVEDEQLSLLSQGAHARGRSAYGSARVHRALAKQGILVSRKRVVRLMQAGGLWSAGHDAGYSCAFGRLPFNR
ncbi:MAG: IS3 family transposase [Myxococcaceae bacterium]